MKDERREIEEEASETSFAAGVSADQQLVGLHECSDELHLREHVAITPAPCLC